MTEVTDRVAVDNIVARLERLPTSWWQVKTRIIVGVATFFDAFDALAIASVLPVIAPLWKLAPQQIGFMISAGFLGQLAGALLFGFIAERYGRMTAMIWSIALFGVMSLVCAFAWDYNSLLIFRTIQGVGLGGEVPVAAVFISELAKAHGRGRFVLLYELVFPIGLVAASLLGLWVVPHLGWQYMFVIGALPALLALVLRSLLPESPRWLAVHGRHAEAEAATEGDRSAAAVGEAGRVHRRQTRGLSRSHRPALFATHVGGVGGLVLRLLRELRALDLAADLVSNRIQAPARRVAAIRIDHAGRRPPRHADLRIDHRPCGAATVVCVLLRRGDAGFGHARPLPRSQRGAGADLHDHRVFLHQHHQYRRLSLHAGTLSHARARARGGGRHGLAAVGLHHRPDGRGDDDCLGLAGSLRDVCCRCWACGCHHRSLCR